MLRLSAGDFEKVDDPDAPKQRGYTTRAKKEEQRNAVVFQGRVRHWEKRWTLQGHLTVLRWVRSETSAPDSSVAAAAGEERVPPSDEQSRKRPRT